MDPLQVSLIIPNWNGENLLPICLDSLEKQTFKNFETIVVDNGSSDNSIKLIKKNYPLVKIIKLNKNFGFSYAVNTAVEKSSTSYFALLNNDTEADKDWLGYLVETIKRNPKLAGVASKMIDFTNRDLIDNAGDTLNIVGQPYPRGKGEIFSKDYQAGYVFGVTGGASLYNREIFENLGKFDEDFFFYFEDVDYALRAQLVGYKFYFQPKAIVYHHSAKSAARLGNFIEYLRFRNTMYLVIKNFPIQLLFKRLRFIKIPLVWVHTFFFFSKKGMFFWALKAWISVLVHLPVLFKKRFMILKNRRVPILYLDNLMEDKKLKILNFKF